jgi:hypothetical protein
MICILNISNWQKHDIANLANSRFRFVGMIAKFLSARSDHFTYQIIVITNATL